MLRLRPRENAAFRPIIQLPVTVEPVQAAETPDSVPDIRIEAFLNEVEGNLRGFTREARAEIRRELHSHLLASATAFEELGEETAAAMTAAIALFGEPCQIAGRYRDVQRHHRYQSALNLWTPHLRTYGLAAAILIAYQSVAFFASAARWLDGFHTLEYSISQILSAVLPVAAGIRAGLQPDRFTVWRSLAILSVFSALTFPFVVYACNQYSSAHVPHLPVLISLLDYLGALFFCWIPIGVLSVVATRLVTRRIDHPADNRTVLKYAVGTIAGATAVDVALSTLCQTLGSVHTYSPDPMSVLLYEGWIMLFSPFVAGVRTGWETRRLDIRSALAGCAASTLLMLIAAGGMRLLFPGIAATANQGLVANIYYSLVYCIAAQIVRIPLTVLGAAAGGRLAAIRMARKQERRICA